jgi:hypothetical protein
MEFKEFGRVEDGAPIASSELVDTQFVLTINCSARVFQRRGPKLNHGYLNVTQTNFCASNLHPVLSGI